MTKLIYIALYHVFRAPEPITSRNPIPHIMMDTTISERSEPFLPDGNAPNFAPSRRRVARLVVVVSTVTIGTSFQFGFGQSALNNLDQTAATSLAAAGTPVALSQWALVVSGFGLGGLLGSIVVARLSAHFGHKIVLLATNAFVVASSTLLMVGTTWPVLFLGRVCSGMVAGSARQASDTASESGPHPTMLAVPWRGKVR